MIDQAFSNYRELDSIDLRTATFVKLEGDMIWVKYKPIDEEFTVEDAKKHSEALSELDGGVAKHLIIDFRGVEVNFSNEAREYFAKSQDHSSLRKSQALIIDSLAHKLVANFYKKFNKPDCPVMIFNSPKDAVEWIESLK